MCMQPICSIYTVYRQCVYSVYAMYVQCGMHMRLICTVINTQILYNVCTILNDVYGMHMHCIQNVYAACMQLRDTTLPPAHSDLAWRQATMQSET